MSTEIDQRIVEMKFDNKNFEKNVSTSMTTLEKFKQSLKFTGATKGIEEIEKESSKFNLSKMEKAVDSVEAKFSTLSIVAISAINRIVSRATDAGISLVKSLSVDQITAGWQKYGDKTESVQTIMNATGKSIDQVNKYLDKLTWFSDETSYGFNDMTKAIAQMTSSGGDINKLIPMVEGVANATAFAGKSADVFSRVMYNLNQSYATGALKYIDWKSLEMAGVASEQLKQTLIDTAVALGTIKEGEVTIANFGETLKKDWATTEVMEKGFGYFAEMSEKAYQMVQSGEVETATEAYEILGKEYNTISLTAAKAAQEAMTFNQVIDATKDAVSSKWMKTFELIFGNYEEAKRLWSDLAEEMYTVFAESGTRRNEILSEGLQSGLQQLLSEGLPSIEYLQRYLTEAADASDSLDSSMKELIHTDFEKSLEEGWVTSKLLGDALFKATKDVRIFSDEELIANGYTNDQVLSMRAFNEALLDGTINLDDYAAKLGRVSGRDNLVSAFWNLWDALFAVDEETGKALGIISVFREAVSEIFPPATGDLIYSITKRIRDFTERLKPSEASLERLKSIFKGVSSAVDIVSQVLNAVWRSLEPVFNILRAGSNTVLDLVANIGENITAFANAAREGDLFYGVIRKIVAGLENVIDIAKIVLKPIKDLAIAILEFVGIKSKNDDNIFSGLTTTVEKASGALAFFKSTAEKVSGVIQNIRSKISNGVEGIAIDLTKPIDILKSIWSIAEAMVHGLINIIGDVLGLIRDLFNSLEPSNFRDLLNTILFALITIDVKGITDALSNILDPIVGVFESLQKRLNADTILTFAKAIGIFTLSIVALSLIDTDKLLGSISAIGIMIEAMIIAMKQITEIVQSMKLLDTAKLIGVINSFKSMAIALAIASAAMFILGKLEWEEIAKGLTSVVGVMTIFVIVTKVLSTLGKGTKNATTAIKSLLPFAISLVIVASALRILAKLEWEEIGKGLVVIAGVMTIMVLTIAAISDMTGNLKGAQKALRTLLPVALAFVLFGVALHIVASLEWEEIGKGLVAFGATMVIMVAALKILSSTGASGIKALAASTSLLVISIALIAVGAALHIAASLEWEEIGKGLVVFSATMLAMVAALKILSSAGSSGTKTAAAAASILVVSASLLVLAVAIKAISKIPVANLTTAVIALAAALVAIVGVAYLATPVVGPLLALGGAIALIGVGALAAGAGITLFATGLATLVTVGPAAIDILAEAIIALVTTLVTLAPSLGTAMAHALASFAQEIVNFTPVIGKLIQVLVELLFNVLTQEIPKMVLAIEVFLSSVLDMVVSMTPKIVKAVTDLLTSILDGIVQFIPVMVRKGTDIIVGLLEGIRDAIPRIGMVVAEIIMSFLTTLADMQLYIVNGAFDLAISFLNSLADTIRIKKKLLLDAIKNLLDALFGDIISRVEEWKSAASQLVNGFINGINAKVREAIDAVKEFGNKVLAALEGVFDINSPSRVTYQDGRYVVEGLAEGIKSDMSAEEAAKKKAENIINAFKDVLTRHDLEIKAIELDYKTQRLENPFWSKEELKDLEIEELEKKIEKSKEKFRTQEAEFRAIAEKFDKDSTEYLEASNKYDQAWIDYLELQHELANLRASRDEPELVFDELGNGVIQGFLYGITSDMTMEDAAKQKAANIVSAFNKVFENNDYWTGLDNIQMSIWQIANPEWDEHAVGFGLTEEETNTQQMVAKILQNEKDLAAAAEQAKYAQAEYQAFLESGVENAEMQRELFQAQQEAEKAVWQLAAEQQDLKKYKPSWDRATALIAEMSQEEKDNFFNTIAEDNPIAQIFYAAMDAAKDIGPITIDYSDVFAPLTDNDAYDDIVDGVEVVFTETIPEAIINACGPGSAIDTAANDAGLAVQDSFVSSFSDGWVKKIFDAKTYGLNDAAYSFGQEAWQTLRDAFNSGEISRDTYDVQSGLLTSVLTGVERPSTTAGAQAADNYVAGYMNDMRSARPDIYDATNKTMGAAVEGSSDALGENSPSKIAEAQGEYYIIGFCNGLLHMVDLLKSTSEDTVQEAVDVYTGVLTRLDRVFQNDLDVAPTISPVLDISSIQFGAGQIEKMFDTQQTYRIASEAYIEAEESRAARERATAQMIVDSIGARIEGIGASLDDLRDVVESHGDSDLIIDVNVDGAALARMTVPDYIYASRAAGTPFYDGRLF